jgi:hypothetical protein
MAVVAAPMLVGLIAVVTLSTPEWVPRDVRLAMVMRRDAQVAAATAWFAHCLIEACLRWVDSGPSGAECWRRPKIDPLEVT